MADGLGVVVYFRQLGGGGGGRVPPPLTGGELIPERQLTPLGSTVVQPHLSSYSICWVMRGHKSASPDVDISVSERQVKDFGNWDLALFLD